MTMLQCTIAGGRTKGAKEKSFVFVHQHGGYDVTWKLPIEYLTRSLHKLVCKDTRVPMDCILKLRLINCSFVFMLIILTSLVGRTKFKRIFILKCDKHKNQIMISLTAIFELGLLRFSKIQLVVYYFLHSYIGVVCNCAHIVGGSSWSVLQLV